MLETYHPPNGYQVINYRRDPCDPTIGLPPAEKHRLAASYYNPSKKLILKVRPANQEEKFWREAISLLIAQQAGLPVAKVNSLPTVENGYVSYTNHYIEHESAASVNPSLAAQVIAKLHSVYLPTSYASGIDTNVTLADYSQKVSRHPKCPAYLKQIIENKCLSLSAQVETDMKDNHSFVHGDLHLANLLPSQPQPSMIDFENAGRGSPIWDIARIEHLKQRFQLDGRWYEIFLATYRSLTNNPLDKLELYFDYYDWRLTLQLWDWVQNELVVGYEAELEKRLKSVGQNNYDESWIRPHRQVSQ